MKSKRIDSKRSARILTTGVLGSLILLGLSPAGASSANISHSYKSQSTIGSGSIVSLDKNTSDYVLPANTQNGSSLLGVAVAKNDSLLAVDENETGVQVATQGDAKTLVSDVNGDIKVGDQVGVSSFDGIGMKAGPGSRVIGLAQTAFTHSTSGASSQEVTDKSGDKKQIAVGYVSVSIAIGVNNTGSKAENLSALQKLGKSLTGHTVSNTRVLISLLVALVALFSLITLVYASIYGGIISIGRNPLAKYAVFRTMGAVFAMVGLIAAVAGVTIFLLLS
ncbi:MAG: hypothetical protein QFB87_05580 [Patescibacteria group bacterium]|nr:hypothetical protein [Patescibacteria group bacterium]